ncbi:MAG: ferrochelatase [Candidatus Nanopelagicales bacterium]
MGDDPLAPFDAVLLLSFGGPEAPDEVMPFLEYVTRGRGIPRERLESVATHYHDFGGVSPINAQNRELLSALEPQLRAAGSALPVYWGNRNSRPWLREVALQMRDDGIRRPLVLVTSAYSSYSGCRQYREDLAEAFAGLGMAVGKVAQFFDAEGFLQANAEALSVKLADAATDARLLFVTHSVPVTADAARYVAQHEAVAMAILHELGMEGRPWSLVYCSRSGAPGQPWLEPDINDALRALAVQGVSEVVVAPIGFVSDHMEVRFDLDTEAAATAAGLGIRVHRAATPGVHPAFVDGLVQLLLERAALERGEHDVQARRQLGIEAARFKCAPGCCANPRSQRPALCGTDA